ncbi:hypothetical protein Krac_8934 [Ktedonobacter racemifer DSM 44963]|uniref:Uncharacterized protein n=1 Tax=Ktedonobacter racemifer DSM 44963 TaxID=485913 RepID=D6TQ06_KTERA|nr:hypothetical protein Krac_8934 [Ktedonobacter racemifer DSM 44963]
MKQQRVLATKFTLMIIQLQHWLELTGFVVRTLRFVE